jgi:hypothetical protein
MDLTEMGLGNMDQTDLAQERDQPRAFVNKVINLRMEGLGNNNLTHRICAWCVELSSPMLRASVSGPVYPRLLESDGLIWGRKSSCP